MEESVPSVRGDRSPGPLWDARARHHEDCLRDQALVWISLHNKSQQPLFSREQLLMMQCPGQTGLCGDVSLT